MPDAMKMEINGLALQFHRWSGQSLYDEAGHKIIVFCLHGFMDHGLTFAPLLSHLGWQATAWDARGFGQSSWIPRHDYYHFFDYLRDLHQVLNLLTEKEHQRFLLIGHSMGGMIASLYAGVYPERIAGLINLEGWMVPDNPPESVPQRLRQWLSQCGDSKALQPFRRYASKSELQERMQRQDPQLSLDQINALSGPIMTRDDAGYFWRHDPMHRTRSPQPFRLDQAQACWKNITAPQLLVYGEDSPIRQLPDWDLRMESLGLKSKLKSSDLKSIAQAGHNLHLHQPQQLAQIIAAWANTHGALRTGSQL